MAKRIVKYKLEGDGSVPKWIHDGGHYKESGDLVGITVDDAEYYVPPGLVDVNDAELRRLVKATYPKDKDSEFSEKKVDAMKKKFKEKLGA